MSSSSSASSSSVPARRILVAGATGAVGRVLCGLLRADGHDVHGTTRTAARAGALERLGVTPWVVDVYDAQALLAAVGAARPDVVIHQLTDLPQALPSAPAERAEMLARNARLREIGTRHLVAAALAAGAQRLIAQSIAFAYADGPRPFDESSPLDPAARGVISLETQVLDAPLDGLVLRYGRLYGPGTWFAQAQGSGLVHVDAAADAARRAVRAGARGVYNIVENDAGVRTDKARRELGWDAGFRVAPEAA